MSQILSIKLFKASGESPGKQNNNNNMLYAKNKLPANIQKQLLCAANNWDNDDLDWDGLKKALVDFVRKEQPSLKLPAEHNKYTLNQVAASVVVCFQKSDDTLKFVFDAKTGRLCVGKMQEAIMVYVDLSFEEFCMMCMQ